MAPSRGSCWLLHDHSRCRVQARLGRVVLAWGLMWQHSEGSAGARGPASARVPSQGCLLEALVPCHGALHGAARVSLCLGSWPPQRESLLWCLCHQMRSLQWEKLGTLWAPGASACPSPASSRCLSASRVHFGAGPVVLGTRSILLVTSTLQDGLFSRIAIEHLHRGPAGILCCDPDLGWGGGTGKPPHN